MTDKSKGCMIGCLLAFAIAAIAGTGMFVVCGVLAAAIGGMDSLQDSDGYGRYRAECEKVPQKIWVRGEGDVDDPVVVTIPLRGIIAGIDGSLARSRKGSSLAALDKVCAATEDEDVIGICLQIDTPGGEVTASDVLADALERFRKSREGRFVFVHMGAMCCSGGYYVAAGADYIMAHPTTMTGSIGVLMETLNAAPLAKKVGVDSVVIATGDNKALLDPFKPVSPEHVDIVRKVVAADYERFLSVVAKGRKMKVDEVRGIADGRVFPAEEAKRLGLIDGIGYADDAYAQICRLAKADDVRIYRYEDRNRLRDLLMSSFLFEDVDGLAGALESRLSDRAALRAQYLMK